MRAQDTLWKLWCRLITGGAPYRPSFVSMFLDPMFLQMEIVPSDLPPTLMPAIAISADPPGTARAGGAAAPGRAGGPLPPTGNAPANIFVPAPDLPWIPSSSAQAGVRTFMPGNAPVFNVLLLNDQADWAEASRPAVQAAVAAGRGIVVFHHALGDNQNWPAWYQEITGGLLVLRDGAGMKKSTITANVTMNVRPVGSHPIVQDIGPLHLVGETAYKGTWQSSKITPLLETTTAASDRVVAWIGPNQSARVVVIQPGQSPETHRNPAFRKLVRNAVLWAGGRLD